MKNAVLFFSIFFPRPFHLLFSNFVSSWAAWVLVAVWAFSSRSAGGVTLQLGRAGFSLRWRPVAERRLQGPWAQQSQLPAPECRQQLWPTGWAAPQRVGPRTRARARVSCSDRPSLYRRATQGSPSFSSLFFFPIRPLLPFQEGSLVACDRFLSPYPCDPVVVFVTRYHFTIIIVNHAILQLQLVLCLKG